MLNVIKKFFDDNLANPRTQKSLEEQLHLASAALLVEVSYADHDISDTEKQVLKKVLVEELKLEQTLADELISVAEDEVREHHSTFQFTRLINEHFDRDSKFRLLQSMWHIAYADKGLDRYEEAMIRKLAELLYLPHSDFIRAKLIAEEQAHTRSKEQS